jgi:ribonucleoside-diphosphate reductase alpha chain
MSQSLASPAASTLALTVKKRNGQQVPFFEVRIQRAIESAFKDFLKVPFEVALKPEVQRKVEEVTERVVAWCHEQAEYSSILFIEDIQDAVIEQLKASGEPGVAQAYADYRHQQELKRFESQRIIVQKRDGRTVSFKPEKIAVAIGKAFAASAHDGVLTAEHKEAVLRVADQVVAAVRSQSAGEQVVHIEAIQDLVEQALMELGHHAVARRYIRYREERHQARAAQPEVEPSWLDKEKLTLREVDGTLIKLDLERLKLSIAEVCRGLEDEVSVERILRSALRNCYDGIPADQWDEAVLLAVRALIEEEPAYSSVAARLLLRQGFRELTREPLSFDEIRAAYPQVFQESIAEGVEAGLLDPQLLERFDLQRLGKAIKAERDLLFGYMGLRTLYDRYFIHREGRRIESPQIFWMRVAMGLCVKEEDPTARAMEFYEVLSTFRFVSSTPTLFNSGTRHPQLSSCFLTTVGDDLDHIFKCIKDDAMLSKWSGGLGNDWTQVRALGALIKGTNGTSQGVVPFLKVANDTAVAVNQGGKRQGAMCAYLEVWHLDIEEFLDLRKNTGDDRRRTHDMHTANWIPDLFMQRVQADGPWTLFSPNEVPDLHDRYGAAFKARYEHYEALAQAGKLRQHKVVPAVQLWRKMLSMLFETGHPWITFKDPSNVRSPQDHAGVVHSSNLCTEILLNTSHNETAVCNLGSVNIAAHTTPSGLDRELLAETVRTAVRMLDNVIDINYYPTVEAKTSNLQHRPIGLGVMGFQDALYTQGMSYASHEAIEFADESMEFIAYHAILASSELAKERGPYASFKGSKWDRGLLPIDTLAVLEQERGGDLDMDRTVRMDWAPVRASIKQYGMRNSNTMAIAPTATIANITGITQSIEPMYKNLFVKSNLSGEFTVINPALVKELKALGLWDQQMIQDL